MSYKMIAWPVNGPLLGGVNSAALNPRISYSQPLTHSRHTAYFKQQEAVTPPAAFSLVFTSSKQASNGSPAATHGLRLHNHLRRHHCCPCSMASRRGSSSNLSVPLPTQACLQSSKQSTNQVDWRHDSSLPSQRIDSAPSIPAAGTDAIVVIKGPVIALGDDEICRLLPRSYAAKRRRIPTSCSGKGRKVSLYHCGITGQTPRYTYSLPNQKPWYDHSLTDQEIRYHIHSLTNQNPASHAPSFHPRRSNPTISTCHHRYSVPLPQLGPAAVSPGDARE